MTEYRDLSKLPDDPAYWAALESRITGDLAPALRSAALARTTGGWWAPVARRAGVLAGLAVAAGIAALFLIPPRPPAAPLSPTGILRPPSGDPLITAFVTSAAPPGIASLIIAGADR